MKPRSMYYLLAAVIITGLNCGIKDTAGNSSETGNAAIVGMIYNSDGVSPAKEIPVVIRPKNSLPGIPSMEESGNESEPDSVFTDNNGTFTFDATLTPGTYAIEAISEGKAVFISPVNVEKDSTIHLAPEKLKPVGAITGEIKLPEGGDTREVFILAFGIGRFVQADANGTFEFPSLAEGIYDLRFISADGTYGWLDVESVSVAAGETTVLDGITLPVSGIPAPENLTISYDTLHQVAIICWSRPDTAIIKSFNIYRWETGSDVMPEVPINRRPILDTFYVDSTGLQDRRYEYAVASVDENASEMKSDPVVTTFASFFVLDTVYHNPVEGIDESQVKRILVGNNGDIYLQTIGTVYIFDAAMQYKRHFGERSTLVNMMCINAQGLLCLADYYEINMLDTVGTTVATISGMHGVKDIAIKDSMLYVYINNHGDYYDSIAVYSPAGERINVWSCGSLRKGGNLIVDNENTVWINVYDSILSIDNQNDRSPLFTMDGQRFICSNGSDAEREGSIRNVAFDAPSRRYFVLVAQLCDTQWVSILYVLNNEGKYVAEYRLQDDSAGANALALGPDGTVFVVSDGNVYRFTLML